MLRKIFIEAFNRIYEDKAHLIEDFAPIIEMLADTTALERESAELQSECAIVMELIRKYVEENAQTTLDQGEYQRRYEGLVTRYESAKKRHDAVKAEGQARAAKRESIARFFSELDKQDSLLTAFDEDLWYSTVETMTVHSERDVEVEFKDGSKVHVSAIGK